MYELTIPDMTCGHCQKTITGAVLAIDGNATLNFDMAVHKLSVTSEAEPSSPPATTSNRRRRTMHMVRTGTIATCATSFATEACYWRRVVGASLDKQRRRLDGKPVHGI
jgi:copper chaperone